MKLSIFNLNNFNNFLIQNNVIVTIVSFSIANYMVRLIDSLFENIIFSSEKSIYTRNLIFNVELVINKQRFKVGKFLFSIAKFALCVILVFIISIILNDMIV